jgi:myo-inositol 2-dehydrogenase / D-chiro-inositol 1-dehydrogenase
MTTGTTTSPTIGPTIRVGIIGTGVMGADHAHTLATQISGARLGAVFDVDEDRAQAAVEGIPGAVVHADPLALINAADLDAVLVASSDATHEEFVLACLAADKPVLCEKPLAPTVEGCRRIIKAELALGHRLVTVGFMRRYDEWYMGMRRALEAGEVGDPLLLHCVHRNPSAPHDLPSETLVTGSAVHEIDVARWLLGDEIAWVSGYRPRRSSRVPGETQDPQFLVLETRGGVLVDVEVFVNARYGYDVRCELVGEEGTVSIGSPTGLVTRRDRHESRTVATDWRDRFAGAYRAELQDWVDHVAAGTASGASSWDGYAATAVAEACVNASAGAPRTAVPLDPRPELYS